MRDSLSWSLVSLLFSASLTNLLHWTPNDRQEVIIFMMKCRLRSLIRMSLLPFRAIDGDSSSLMQQKLDRQVRGDPYTTPAGTVLGSGFDAFLMKKPFCLTYEAERKSPVGKGGGGSKRVS